MKFRVAVYTAVIAVLSLAALAAFASEAANDRRGPSAAIEPVGMTAGIVYDAADFPRDGKRHVIEFRFVTATGRDLVTQKFTMAVLPIRRVPPIVLLAEEDVQTRVLTVPHVSVDISIDGHQPARLTLADLEARDSASRNRALDAAQRQRLFSPPAASQPATSGAISRHTPTVLFQCPEADWSYCEEEYAACDSTCDPYDPYNNCQACRDNHDYCINGQPQGTPQTEDTLVSYTGSTNLYCSLDDGGRYGSRNEYRHVVERQYYWCKESGYYSEIISSYYYNRTCYHKFEDVCAFFPYIYTNGECTY